GKYAECRQKHGDISRFEKHIYFFFFQAEDGIRDLTVTGVQTCALPICMKASVTRPVSAWRSVTVSRSCQYGSPETRHRYDLSVDGPGCASSGSRAGSCVKR